MNIGPTELILILVIALIVFGPKRLPEVGRTIGKAMREFRQASQDIRDEFQMHLDDDEAPRSTPSPAPPQAIAHEPASGNGQAPRKTTRAKGAAASAPKTSRKRPTRGKPPA